MGRTSEINPEDFDIKIKLLKDFFSPSKVYPYSNYITITAREGIVELKLPIIIGEAINSGGMAIKVEAEVIEPFEIIVPCKEFLDACAITKGTPVTLDTSNGHLTIGNGRKELRVPLGTTAEGIPVKISHDFEIMKQEATTTFDINALIDILDTIGKEIKAQTIDFDFHGVYITEDESYVTNGMSITKYSKGIEGGPYYIPYFAIKLFKSFKDSDISIASKELYEGKSPFMYFTMDGVEFYMQEWMGKATYPAEAIRGLYSNTNLVELDVFKIADALLDISTLGKFVHLNFREGVATDEQKRITVEIPKMDQPDISFTSELLPRKTDYKHIQEIHLVSNGLDTSMIKFGFGDVDKLVAKVVTQ